MIESEATFTRINLHFSDLGLGVPPKFLDLRRGFPPYFEKVGLLLLPRRVGCGPPRSRRLRVGREGGNL